MKKIIIAVLILGAAVSALNAAGISLSNLSAGNSVKGTDLFYDVQSTGVGGVKVTGSQLATFMWASPTFTGTLTFPDTSIWGNGGLTATIVNISTLTMANFTTSTLCLHVVTGGTVSATGSDCGIPGGANTQVQFNNNNAFAGDSTFTFATPGRLTLGMGTIASNLKALNVTVTWNSSAVKFDAPLFVNATNTASAVNSLLADFQLGGTPIFQVGRPSTTSDYSALVNGGGLGGGSGDRTEFEMTNVGSGSFSNQILFSSGTPNSLTNHWGLGNDIEGVKNDDFWVYNFNLNTTPLFLDAVHKSVTHPNNWVIGFGTSTIFPLGTPDAAWYRDAAVGVMSLGDAFSNSTATGLRVYNTTDQVGSNSAPTNYERGIFDWTGTANQLTIGSQASGSGIGRSVAIVASNTTAMFVSPTGVISLYNQQNPVANETFAVCAATGATLTTGGQLFVDTTACLASTMMVKHNIAAFNNYGMTQLASLAAPLHAESRLAQAPIDVDPIAEAMALVPVVATYDTLEPNSPQFTLIAQNACNVDERLCERTKDGDIRAFRPNGVISILVAAIQKQQAEIDELKSRLR